MGVYSSREAAIKNAKVVIQTDSRNRRQFEHCNRHERLGWGGSVPIGEIVRTSFGQEVGRGGGRHGGIGDSLYGVWRLTQCITDESVYTGSVWSGWEYERWRPFWLDYRGSRLDRYVILYCILHCGDGVNLNIFKISIISDILWECLLNQRPVEEVQGRKPRIMEL